MLYLNGSYRLRPLWASPISLCSHHALGKSIELGLGSTPLKTCREPITHGSEQGLDNFVQVFLVVILPTFFGILNVFHLVCALFTVGCLILMEIAHNRYEVNIEVVGILKPNSGFLAERLKHHT